MDATFIFADKKEQKANPDQTLSPQLAAGSIPFCP